jgi:acyl-CoA synthetase (AMP-forming)/AMP-acid ligase II
MIHRSRFPDPVIPNASLPAFLLAHAIGFGDRPALIDGLTGQCVTYVELARRVHAVARGLAGSGVRPGQVVGLVSPNQPAWAIAFLGVLSAGAAIAPINPALTPAEIAHQLTSSGACMLISDGSVRDQAAEAATASGVRPLALDRLEDTSPRQIPPSPPAPELDAVVATTIAVVASSSGTTGLPKGVLLTHRNLVACLCQHETIYHVGPDDVFLATLPFFHIYGLSIILSYGLRHGATIVTLPRFRPDQYLSLIAARRVTWLHLVPPMVLLLGSVETTADLSSVRHAVSGAAPLDPTSAARAASRLGCNIGQGYGMTEASPGVTWVPDDDASCPAGSVGYLLPGTQARIIDPVTGTDTAGEGELWVRGPQVMAGYLANPEATSETIVEDGWLRTGDIMRVDAAGAWWVVDRLKELIKYKGHQVAPAELEALLLDHPGIADAAVVGIPDPEAGQTPKAFVVPASRDLEADEVLAWCAARVAPYKRLRAVELVDEIPRSPSGKILRRVLANRVAGHGHRPTTRVGEGDPHPPDG